MSDIVTSELMEKVRRIELRTRRIVNNRTIGAWHASFKGQGVEFAEVREYQEGDDIRAIDANVSARFDHPFIKLFTEEREQNVFLLVDRSASHRFASTKIPKDELVAEIAAVLAFSATMNKDRVGLMIHTDKEELHLSPGRGHRHVLRIIRELIAFETESRKTNLGIAIEHLLATTLRKSIVFIIGDLLTPGFESPLRALARKHEVIVLHLTDPLERELPKLPPFVSLAVQDLEDDTITTIASRHAKSLADRVKAEHSHIAKSCRRCGADYVFLDTNTDYLPAIVGLFDRRMSRR